MSASLVNAPVAHLGWIDWLKRELAPSHERKVRTLILVCGAVLCVIISMALQVHYLAVSAYMVFFISKENKVITTLTGVLGLIGVTIAIGISLLFYKVTYGHPELGIPSIAIVLFLGMYLSRILVIGPLGFALGFVIAVTQAEGGWIPFPEPLVREMLWLWIAVAYGVGLTVILNRLFLPKPSAPPSHLPKPKSLFVSDAFTNPAHVHFALKVTLAAMVCYIIYSAIDWPGIRTAFITCVFISLESTGATFRKGVLRIVGCLIGGSLALFSIVFLVPHMETIASLVLLVAAVSAIAGWVASGTERIAYAGLQIAFAFFVSVFQGYAPDTDLDNVRNRVIGILLGLIVTGLVFHYIWPERAIDRLLDTLRQALRQLAQLLEIPRSETSIETAKPEAHALIAETSRSFDQARRQAELTLFEFEEVPSRERISVGKAETTLLRAESVFITATSLVSDDALDEWQQLPPPAKIAESELRNIAAHRVECAASSDTAKHLDGADISIAFARWNETMLQLAVESSRTALVARIAAEVQHLE